MNKKNYLLALTPLLFVACVNTQPEKEKTVTAPLKSVVEIKKEVINTPVSKTLASSSAVTFITNKNVSEEGMMHIETLIGSLKPSLENLIQLNGQKKMSTGACSLMAKGITTDYNNLISKIKLKRIALEHKDPGNKADLTDKMVIDTIINKNKIKPLVVQLQNSYRVYQPIAINESYLLCYGENNDSNPVEELQGAIVAEIQK
jgi:hypothetical protein